MSERFISKETNLHISVTNSSEISSAEQSRLSIVVAGWTQRANQRNEAILIQDPDRLNEQMSKGLTFIAFDNNNFPVGHVTLYNLGIDERNTNWFEVGTLLVEENSRGRGIGNTLCESLTNFLPNSYLVPTTKNPIAVKAFLAAGFEIVSYRTIPENIRQGLCIEAPCYRPTNGAPSPCSSEHNEGGWCFALARKPIW